MTDKEIIKALERMSEEDAEGFSSDVLALINRQQAEIEICSEVIGRQDKEIEKLNEFANERLDKFTERYDRNLKAEAIKEFAEKLKRKAYRFPCAIGTEYAVPIRAINEMAGDEE